MKLRSLGLGYWCLHRRRGPFIARAYSNEIEPPFRKGRGFSIRLPVGALTVGRWVAKYSEGDPDLWSLNGRDLPYTPEDIDGWSADL